MSNQNGNNWPNFSHAQRPLISLINYKMKYLPENLDEILMEQDNYVRGNSVANYLPVGLLDVFL